MFKFLSKLNDKLYSKIDVSVERVKIRHENNKGDHRKVFYIKFILSFVTQYVLGLFIIGVFFEVLLNSGLNDQALYSALKKFGSKDFLYVAMGVSAVSLVGGVNKVALSSLVFFAALLLFSIQVINFVPNSLVFNEQHAAVKFAVLASLLTILISMIWIPFNAVVVLFTRISNLNPVIKNDSAQPSHVPIDLAHDLRYSRSRARHFRARR